MLNTNAKSTTLGTKINLTLSKNGSIIHTSQQGADIMVVDILIQLVGWMAVGYFIASIVKE